MTFEMVERPRGGGSSGMSDEFIKALLETEQNGKALQITLEGQADFVRWQAGVRARVKTHGKRLRTKFNKVNKKVTCWVEAFHGDRDVEDVDLGVTED